jgi:hypothetical protein
MLNIRGIDSFTATDRLRRRPNTKPVHYYVFAWLELHGGKFVFRRNIRKELVCLTCETEFLSGSECGEGNQHVIAFVNAQEPAIIVQFRSNRFHGVSHHTLRHDGRPMRHNPDWFRQLLNVGSRAPGHAQNASGFHVIPAL